MKEPVKEEVKQQLKQVVHCTTQEEWDFVSEKINHKFVTVYDLGVKDTINLSDKKCEYKLFYQRCIEYQVLSFQEWCDLNGYKMEKEVKFEVGEWYKVVYKNPKQEYYLKYLNNRHEFGYSEYIVMPDGRHSVFHAGNDLDAMTVPIKVSIAEIQQYLPDDHPDKISATKDTSILNESCIGKFISNKLKIN